MNTTHSIPPANRSRRQFFQVAGALSATTLAAKIPGDDSGDGSSLPPAFSALKPLSDRGHPITAAEFRARIDHAQRLMAEPPLAPNASPSHAPNYYPLFLSPGTS